MSSKQNFITSKAAYELCPLIATESITNRFSFSFLFASFFVYGNFVLIYR